MHTTNNQGTQHRTRDMNLPSHTQEPAIQSLIPTSRHVTGDHQDEGDDQENHELVPLNTAPHWALCPPDWHAHAIDAWADHPLGVWIARCGHRLLSGTTLHDTPPGSHCPACTRWSQPQRTQDTTGTTQ